MKKAFQLALIAVPAFLAGIAGAAQLQGQADPLDPVIAAPKNHRVLYEDDHIRLLEVTVEPGETENVHFHKYPSVIALDAAQPKLRIRFESGQTIETGRNFKVLDGANVSPEVQQRRSQRHAQLEAIPATGVPAGWGSAPDPAAHQITNLDTFPHHFYRLEFKRMDGNEIMKLKQYGSGR